MYDKTMTFSVYEDKEKEMKTILTTVYDALKEKGYNPINQIVGYILSEDPTYITTHNNARSLIRRVDRDELLRAMVKAYLNDQPPKPGVLKHPAFLKFCLTFIHSLSIIFLKFYFDGRGLFMENKTNGLAIGSLILGIFTLVMACFGQTFAWGTIIGVITGIVGIILGVMGKKKSPSGVATGGLVTSIIGLVLCGILFIACVACAGVLVAAGATL